MHASQEERLSSEGKGITKDSPLNPDNSLNPASGDPIITDTAVSKNFPGGVPVSSGSALVDTSSPQSGPHEFQMQKNSEAPSYIAVPDPSVLKQGFSKDPSTWCVDEVIQFMKHKDPQISGPLADLFRQHEIDGKALLLLKSDLVMKYMGLKLGPALKLCYYIEKLKEGKHNFKNV
ncbi:PREDICTED: sex comb on midleg-like protein 2 isoform X2 [Miniopterus natalensis]|nr:PREDICTED: sex comb on midleg-like protein 2 isoform X2 [Miniopterus natalensis]